MAGSLYNHDSQLECLIIVILLGGAKQDLVLYVRLHQTMDVRNNYIFYSWR
jgi:hypothetical protein